MAGRIEEIRRALHVGMLEGTISDYYLQSVMPGRRWTVWGEAVSRYEYSSTTPGGGISRTYTTAQVERMLRAAGLLEG